MSVSADPRIGSELLGYQVEALLGRGGMGVVYRAFDARLKRRVALKLVAPELSGEESFRERFLAETEVAASLEHPNVVPIYDAGEVEGQLYLAMRYVEGSDLKSLLQEEAKLTPERALGICAQLAGALDAAHERGLVHRDVKPSNVLLDQREHVYLADFGLTRRLADRGVPIPHGFSLGTPAYVAPEQIEGGEVDGRADLYSLACLLYECLTGEAPFKRDSELATLWAHLQEKPPVPSRYSELAPVLQKALAKDPEQRYASCAALVEAACDALGIAEPSRPRWLQAPVLFSLAGLVLIAAALAAYFGIRGGGGPPPKSGDMLVRIDPETSRVAATIPVGKNPSAVAADDRGVWVANRDDGTVSRIDPATNAVELEASAHGAPADVAIGRTRVVVADGPAEATLTVVDPATGVQQDLFSLAAGQFFGSASIATAASGIWVATGDRRVGRLNVLTGELIDPIVIPQPPAERSEAVFSGIAVGPGAVWVIGDPLEHKAWRIDESTGKLVATVPLPFAPKAIAAGAGGIWVTSQLDDTLSRIDPARNRITHTIPVGRGAAGVAVGGGSVWVANAVDGTVSRVDPQTLQVETIDVDGYPDDVAAAKDAVWVTAHAPSRKPEADAILIGVLAPCEGTFGDLAPVSFAGAELPLLERGATLAGSKPADGVEGASIAGKHVELAFGCGDDSAEKALSETRRLVDVLGADVVIGSYFPGESLAIRDYARRQRAVAFVNGVGQGQEVTLRNPARNYFRFLTDAAQEQAGVGKYAHDTLRWRRVVTIADVRAFHYTQTAGFVAEFCALGGTIVKQIWVPLGTADLATFVAQVPRGGVDGFVIMANPPTALAFFKGLPQLAGRLSDRLIGSILLTVPPLAEVLGERLEGVVFGAPDDTETPTAKAFAARFGKTFPEFAGESFFWAPMYADSTEAVLRALEAVDGDLSQGQRRFQAALAKVELDTPTTGHIRLDERRQAVGPNYLIRLGYANGQFTYKTLSVAREVEETFNGYFKPDTPPPSTNTIECKHGNPPPWTRR